MVSWFKWSNAMLREFGIPAEKIVTTVGRNVEAIAPLCGIYSPHQIGRPDQIVSPIMGVPAARIIYSSDGVKNGAGPADCQGKRGVGMDVANAIGLKIIQLGALGYEYLPRDAYKNNCDRANVDGLDLSVVKAIAFAK
jgi:hypothetical protein